MQEDEIVNEKKTKRTTPRAADYLGGESPRARGERKRRRVLNWLYRWGYSSAEIIRQVAGQQAKGYASGLAKKGWLVETKTESGTPRFLYTLSRAGLQEAERLSNDLLRYPEIDPYKINQQQIRHYLIAQQATVNALAGAIADYRTERQIDQSGDQPGQKRPDVVWQLPEGRGKMGVEIELSAKWDRRLNEFIFGIARALQHKTDKPAEYQRFAVVSDSPAIIRRYQAAMEPGADLPIWKKNQRAHWEVEKVIPVPGWLIERVNFHLLAD